MTDFRRSIRVLEQRLAAIKRTPPSRRPKCHCQICGEVQEAIELLKRESER